jgi:hypothetical protein
MKIPRSQRYPRRYKVTMGRLVAFTANVSMSGFCAELRGQVLPKGTAVEGTFQVGASSIPFTGTVAWSRQGNWHLNVHGKMGIRFTEVRPDLSELLEKALRPR